jgi:hypothetical protein
VGAGVEVGLGPELGEGAGVGVWLQLAVGAGVGTGGEIVGVASVRDGDGLGGRGGMNGSTVPGAAELGLGTGVCPSGLGPATCGSPLGVPASATRASSPLLTARYPLNPASGSSIAPAANTVRRLRFRSLITGSSTVSAVIRRRARFSFRS